MYYFKSIRDLANTGRYFSTRNGFCYLDSFSSNNAVYPSLRSVMPEIRAEVIAKFGQRITYHALYRMNGDFGLFNEDHTQDHLIPVSKKNVTIRF